MALLIRPPQISLHYSLGYQSNTYPRTTHRRVSFPNRRCLCSVSDEQPLLKPPRQKKNTTKQISKDKEGVNPVGFLPKFDISHKAFDHFLRERHKSLKDLKEEILKRHMDFQELSSGFEILGMHRHFQHRVDYMDWAPGARYCALVGDFNGWSPTEDSAREGHFGHDDYGYWFVIIEDKLREGEEPDEIYFQQYNYEEDYDKGDSGVTLEEIYEKSNAEYWEPGEDRFVKNRFEDVAKLYEQIFGPNGPQSLDDMEEIPDAQTRFNAWKESNPDDPDLRLHVIDEGKEYDVFNVVDDPVSRAKFNAKKPPTEYWLETRKGRKAWMKKYTPGVPHGSKYRVYFNTPNGPLERVPAWATYVLPDPDGNQACAVHWEPSPEFKYNWKYEVPKVPRALRIYECHVGISGLESKISSFNDFKATVVIIYS